MEINIKKAPKRRVDRIEKTGVWGNYEYVHYLECGHADVRKRAASTPTVACTDCVRAVVKGEELKALVAVPQRAVIMDVDDMISLDEDHLVEVEAGSLKAGLASALGIPLESIDVVVSDVDSRLVVSSVVVFFSARDAKRVAKIT